jgi:hypothetical protein
MATENDQLQRFLRSVSGTGTGTGRHRGLPALTGPGRTGPAQDRHRPARVVL